MDQSLQYSTLVTRFIAFLHTSARNDQDESDGGVLPRFSDAVVLLLRTDTHIPSDPPLTVGSLRITYTDGIQAPAIIPRRRALSEMRFSLAGPHRPTPLAPLCAMFGSWRNEVLHSLVALFDGWRLSELAPSRASS